MTDFFRSLGPALLERGYLITPIVPGEKRPAIKAWNSVRFHPAECARYTGHGVGLICGRGAYPLASIDIDITHPVIGPAVLDYCLTHLGPAPLRIGAAPRCLLLYRAAELGWHKQASVSFLGPADLAKPNGNPNDQRVEILGAGQQFVAYAIHPDTKQPYDWPDQLTGLSDPVEAPAASLTVVSQEQIAALLSFVESLVSSTEGVTLQAPAILGPVSTGSFEAPLGLSNEQLALALAHLPQTLPYDNWLSVGMALHHETDGAGFELWHAWSAESPKHTSREFDQARWDSFGKRQDGPLTTMRAILRQANEHGAGFDLAAFDTQIVFEDLRTGDTSEKHVLASNTSAANNLKFPVIAEDVFAAGDPPTWLIKDVIPQGALVVLYGESGSGKSFVALDMGKHLTQGAPWRGKRTKQSSVVYIAAEGAGGFRKRLTAYRQHHGPRSEDAAPFGVIHAAPNFVQQEDAVAVCEAIEAWGHKPDLVIVDTFAQVTAGANENSGEDMGLALKHCQGIHRRTGATVLLIHHAGKDPTKGARGWSGIKAAADAEIEVCRFATGRMLRTSKQKDGEDGLAWGFELRVVQLGFDSDGDPVSSCVALEAPLPTRGPVGKQLGEVEQAIIQVIDRIACSQTSGIELKPMIAEAAKLLPEPEDGKRDTRKQRVSRAFEKLCEGDDSPYWVQGDSFSIV